MAGVGGFEPPIEDPKSSALPLGYTPIKRPQKSGLIVI